jgi:hypothetical protein
LKVRDGASADYWWVECGACETAWQFRATPRASGDDEAAAAPRPGSMCDSEIDCSGSGYGSIAHCSF